MRLTCILKAHQKFFWVFFKPKDLSYNKSAVIWTWSSIPLEAELQTKSNQRVPMQFFLKQFKCFRVEVCSAFTPPLHKHNKKATGQDAHMAEFAETREVEALEQQAAESLVQVLGKQR